MYRLSRTTLRTSASPLFPYTTLFRSPSTPVPYATLFRSPADTTAPLLDIRDLDVTFTTSTGTVPAVRGANLCVYRSEEHTSELQSRGHLVCRLLLEKKTDLVSRLLLEKKKQNNTTTPCTE